MQYHKLLLGALLGLFQFAFFPLLASAATSISGTLFFDTTWTSFGSPYVIDGQFIIPKGVTLTIEPGVVVKMGQPSCNCYANIWVFGTLHAGDLNASERVIFTSVHDDTGGDTDGVSVPPQPGDWRMINVGPGGVLALHGTDLRYGGRASTPGTYFNPDNVRMVNNSSGTVTLHDVEMSFAFGSAAYRDRYMGTTTIVASRFHDNPIGVEIGLAGSTTITDSTFTHNTVGITIQGGTTTIAHTIFSANGTGVHMTSPGGSVTIRDSSFSGHVGHAVSNTVIGTIVDASMNWWGSTSGPRHSSNPTGVGDLVSDRVRFDSWLGEVPGARCTVNCHSNVLFLPGIMGSRLYDSTGDIRWLPENDEEADYVRLKDDGTSVLPDITTLDVIDTADGQQAYIDLYKSFLLEMNEWEDLYHITATSTPYDWRLDYKTIVTSGRKLTNGHISYLLSPESGRDPYLLETLKQLASTSRTGKVTIIGHSQGGLIAKALLQEIGATTTASLIDRVILVATPQLGTPKAITVLLNGANAGIPFAISNAKARELAQNMQSAYNLLPSSLYFTYTDDPVVTISTSSLKTWYLHYGEEIHSDEGLRKFMYDSDVLRAKPSLSDLRDPEIVDPFKLFRARDVHALLDNWTPPPGVQLITISGWGEETLSGVEYFRKCTVRDWKNLCAQYGDISLSPRHVIDGDGTVVESSAQWSNGAESLRYWVNLLAYNKDAVNRDHKNILEIPQLRVLLGNILKDKEEELDYISTIAPAYEDEAVSRLHFTLHSPLSLGFSDEDGRYSGMTNDGSVSHDVRGVRYERYGEVQWLSVPRELSGQLILRGLDSGTFTLEVAEIFGNKVLSSTSFEGVPSEHGSRVTMLISPLLSTTGSSTLEIDQNGDGVVDNLLFARGDSVVPFRVSRSPLTLTADTVTLTLGSPIPPLSGTFFGFIGEDTAATHTTGFPECVTTATAQSPAGVYPITCTIGTFASDAYEITTFIPGTLTIRYAWSGFAPPLSITPTPRIFKHGSTIPLTFTLKDGEGYPVEAPTPPQLLPPEKGSLLYDPLPTLSSINSTTEGSLFHFDSQEQHYRYNLSTKGLTPGYWHTLRVALDDGEVYETVVGIR